MKIRKKSKAYYGTLWPKTRTRELAKCDTSDEGTATAPVTAHSEANGKAELKSRADMS